MPTSGSASLASWKSWSAEAPLKGSSWPRSQALSGSRLTPDPQDYKAIATVANAL